MGSIISDVTDAVGLTDVAGQKRAANNAANQQAFANGLTTEQLDFQKQQYSDWKDIYGDIQSNLGDYYKSLSASDYEARGVTQVQQEYSKANTQLQEQLAQRGISNSGIAAAAATSLTQQLANATTEARITAPEKVNQQKMSFLGLGLGQGAQMLGTIANVSNNGASNATNSANSSLNNSTSLSQSNSNTMGTLIGMGMASDIALKDNLVVSHTLNGVTFYTWTWNSIANNLGYVGKSFGVIAQEVAKIIPDCIYVQNGYLAVDYSVVLNYIGEHNGTC
jgi:hypothetical protein